MRANIVFLIALIMTSVYCSTFTQKMNENAEFKKMVNKAKKTNLGSMILTLAELHQVGNFAPLFDAIDDLQEFLADQLLDENSDFSAVTSLWASNVDRLNEASSAAYAQAASDEQELASSLYPERDSTQADIVELESWLVQYNEWVDQLNAYRASQIAIFKDSSADFEAGINSLKQAIPFLEQLVNSGSFLEVHAEQFGSIAHNLKQKLGKLKYGALYQSFVQSMERSFQSGNLVDQEGLLNVIDLLNSLLSRLQDGYQALNEDEEVNESNYENWSDLLQAAISQTQSNLAADQQSLALLEVDIEETEEDQANQTAAGQRADADLADVQSRYAARSVVHNDFLDQIASEQSTIQDAVDLLNKGGITRSS